MPTPMTLAHDIEMGKVTIVELPEIPTWKAHLRREYKVGFVDGIIASSAAYIIITLIALFIGSYQ